MWEGEERGVREGGEDRGGREGGERGGEEEREVRREEEEREVRRRKGSADGIRVSMVMQSDEMWCRRSGTIIESGVSFLRCILKNILSSLPSLLSPPSFPLHLQIQGIISAAKFIQPSLGELPGGLKGRLADSNKNLVRPLC